MTSSFFAWQTTATKAATSTAPMPGGQAPQSPIEPLFNLLTFVGIPFLLFWFLMLRPMQKQEKERKSRVALLKKNDEVLLNSGIIGKVISIKEKPGGIAGAEDEVIIQTEGNNRIRVVRSAIARVADSEAETNASTDGDKK